MARWTTAQIDSQSGRSFVVTGANSGLGFETARQLAVHGARVTLTCRSDAKGRAAVDRIRAESPGALVEFRVLDLADLDSVRAFAAAGESRDGGWPDPAAFLSTYRRKHLERPTYHRLRAIRQVALLETGNPSMKFWG